MQVSVSRTKSFAKRLIRPIWERLLSAATARVGVRRVINSTPFYVDSRVRNWFSETYDSGVTALVREQLRQGDEGYGT